MVVLFSIALVVLVCKQRSGSRTWLGCLRGAVGRAPEPGFTREFSPSTMGEPAAPHKGGRAHSGKPRAGAKWRVSINLESGTFNLAVPTAAASTCAELKQAIVAACLENLGSEATPPAWIEGAYDAMLVEYLDEQARSPPTFSLCPPPDLHLSIQLLTSLSLCRVRLPWSTRVQTSTFCGLPVRCTCRRRCLAIPSRRRLRCAQSGGRELPLPLQQHTTWTSSWHPLLVQLAGCSLLTPFCNSSVHRPLSLAWLCGVCWWRQF